MSTHVFQSTYSSLGCASAPVQMSWLHPLANNTQASECTSTCLNNTQSGTSSSTFCSDLKATEYASSLFNTSFISVVTFSTQRCQGVPEDYINYYRADGKCVEFQYTSAALNATSALFVAKDALIVTAAFFSGSGCGGDVQVFEITPSLCRAGLYVSGLYFIADV